MTRRRPAPGAQPAYSHPPRRTTHWHSPAQPPVCLRQTFREASELLLPHDLVPASHADLTGQQPANEEARGLHSVPIERRRTLLARPRLGLLRAYEWNIHMQGPGETGFVDFNP